MDEEYILMCKEAKELKGILERKSDALYCEGYHVYFTTRNFGDPEFDPEWTEHVIQTFDLDKPLFEPEEIEVYRQEELQEIYSDKLGRQSSMIMADFCMWMKDHPYPRDHEVWQDITRLWLTFVMEKIFWKSWNSETKKWETVWWEK